MSSFSVLMSVYYKEQALYLKEALDSIWLNQILKPDQIVLVEDGPLTPELYEVIDEFQKEVGNVLTLVKNENYWNGDVNVDEITVRTISDGDTLAFALQAGKYEDAKKYCQELEMVIDAISGK